MGYRIYRGYRIDRVYREGVLGGDIIYKVLNLLGIVAGIKYFCIFAKKLRRGKGTKWLIIIDSITMRG